MTYFIIITHVWMIHSLIDRKTIQNQFSGVVIGGQGNSTDAGGSETNDKSTQNTNQNNTKLHPAVLSLGLQYTTGTIRGANARTKAMLETFKIIIQDYKPSPSTRSSSSSSSSSNNNQNNKPEDIRSSIEHDLLKPAFHYLSNSCRAHSVTMGNAFRFLKKYVIDLNRDLDLSTIQTLTCDAIDAYIHERIVLSDEAIAKYACMKIVPGDVILTYANSEVIQRVLLRAHQNQEESKTPSSKPSFRVIIVDSRPLLEGRKMLEVCTKAGIECTYIFLNSLSYVMKEVTKVFMGAASLMSDGSVLSRVGTASVALLAHSNNIPVLVCCETYKITSRVQLESITGNELGNPDDLLSTHCAIDRTRTEVEDYHSGSGSSIAPDEQKEVLKDWRSIKSLKLLNLMYDLTPSKFVSGIVTEMGILPVTSVAVLLREMNTQDNDMVFKEYT